MTRMSRAQTLVRRADALKLRLAGDSFREIADALDFRGASGAYAAVEAALTEVVEEPTAQLRAMELARCDAMTKSLWPQVEAGDTDAIRTCLKVMERRAKLTGLDAPVKVDVSELFRREAEAAGLEITPQLMALAAEYDAGERFG